VEATVVAAAAAVDQLLGALVAKVATATVVVAELVLGLVVAEVAEVDTATTPMVAAEEVEEATTRTVAVLPLGNPVAAVAPQAVLLLGHPVVVVVAAPAVLHHGNQTTATAVSNSNTEATGTIKVAMVNKEVTVRVGMDRAAIMLAAKVVMVDKAVVATLGAVLPRLLLLQVVTCLLHLRLRATMFRLHLRLVVELFELIEMRVHTRATFTWKKAMWWSGL